MTPGFSLTSLRIGGGLLVWALHFSAVYIVTALMCARDAADAQWLGLPALPLVIAALTLIAIVALGALARQALRGRWYAEAQRAGQPFLAWIAAMAAGLALVAVIWTALPALWIRACPV